MPRSSSRQPERGTAKHIPLFDRTGPSLRPDLRAARAARAVSVKAGRRPPPAAARSGLDRREHAAPIASGRNHIIPLDQQQSIFEIAASQLPQDEGLSYKSSLVFPAKAGTHRAASPERSSNGNALPTLKCLCPGEMGPGLRRGDKGGGGRRIPSHAL